MRLKSRYPQGAEKVLIYSATKRKLPLGKLPSDVGCIVMNITSISALSKYIKTGMPLVTKRITVDGNAIKNPCNVIVPIGTSAADVIDFCGGFTEEPDKIILGGPMMGNAIVSTDVVVAKPNNAILCFANKKKPVSTACIKCGRCAMACPMRLSPASVEAKVTRKTGTDEFFSKMNVNYCMECGCCSFVCPARRELVQAMRFAKNELRRNAK
jgi:electron transport complex protein RnfC